MKIHTVLFITYLALTSSWQESSIHTLSEFTPPQVTEDNAHISCQTPSFEGIMVLQGIGGNATYYIKGDKVRSEIKGDEDEGIFLYSFSGDSYTVIMPSERIYMEAPVRQIDFSDEDLKELNDCEGNVDKTGDKQSILGISCGKWVVTCGKDRSEMWLTRELGFEWGQIFHPMFRAAYTGNMRQYGDMKGYFPMKMMASNAKGKSEVVMEVVSLERKKLGDELFSVPSGYKNMGKE